MLRAEDCVLLALMRISLFDKQLGEEEHNLKPDWAAVFSEAARQTVLPAATDAVSSFSKEMAPPQGLLLSASHSAIMQMVSNERLLAEQNDLQSLLKENRIPCVILKGATVAARYPRPELRVQGDIDILVPEESLERTAIILSQNGYVQQESHSHRHIAFMKNGASIELHYKAADYPENAVGERIENIMQSWAVEAVQVHLGQYSFSGLGPTHQCLSLLLHMQDHILTTGLGLRHLCDWAIFVNSATQETWEEKIQPVLKECGLLRFAQILTATCVRHLGLPPEKAPWCLKVPERLSDAMIQDFFASGNFGRKDPSRKASSLLLDGKSGTGTGRISLLQAIARLNKRANLLHPWVKKTPFLLPFFWIWQPAQQLLKAGGWRRISPLLKGSLSSARKRSALYSEFRLFQPEK